MLFDIFLACQKIFFSSKIYIHYNKCKKLPLLIFFSLPHHNRTSAAMSGERSSGPIAYSQLQRLDYYLGDIIHILNSTD